MQCIVAFETGVPPLTVCLSSSRHAGALLGLGAVLGLDKSTGYAPRESPVIADAAYRTVACD